MKWHIVPAALVALATAVLLLLAPERLVPGHGFDGLLPVVPLLKP